MRKTVIGLVVLVILVFAAYTYYEQSRQADVLARCNKVGGVYVEAHTGPICVNPEALLNF